MKTSAKTHPNTKGSYRMSSLLILFIIIFLQSCVVINPGQMALKVKRGTLDDKIFVAGRYRRTPNTQFVTFSTRVKEMTLKTLRPTKEGLEAKVSLTMLYHIKP